MIRKNEDKLFAESINSDFICLEYVDAIDRFPMLALRQLFNPALVLDKNLVRKISSSFFCIIKEHGIDCIVAPFGIGNHIDHRIVKRSAEICSENLDVQLCYYLDQPYYQQKREDLINELTLVSSLDVSSRDDLRKLKNRQSMIYSSQPAAYIIQDFINDQSGSFFETVIAGS